MAASTAPNSLWIVAEYHSAGRWHAGRLTRHMPGMAGPSPQHDAGPLGNATFNTSPLSGLPPHPPDMCGARLASAASVLVCRYTSFSLARL